jgi:hypothetical protein
MKTLILALMALVLSAPAFAGETEFHCENRMYRDARFSLNQGEVTVQDSYLKGATEVGEILARQLNLKGELMVNTLSLAVHRDGGVKCDSALAFLVDCQGSNARAYLSVDGWIIADGISGSVGLTVPVQVKDFNLKSHLSNIGGPVSIGGDKPVSIRLSQVNLDATAKVIVDGKEVELAWETFFYAREPKGKGSASSCTKF